MLKLLFLQQKNVSRHYFITDQNGVYFSTFTVTYWIETLLCKGFTAKKPQFRARAMVKIK